VVVDTAFFRGNFPAACALEGAVVEVNDDLAAQPVWRELLPRTILRGDHKNSFAIADRGRVTHVRLKIFPDGGVARLRVHGEVWPDWARLARHGGLVDLAALEHGGFSLAASDMFFGNRQNLLAPGRPVDMSAGGAARATTGTWSAWARPASSAGSSSTPRTSAATRPAASWSRRRPTPRARSASSCPSAPASRTPATSSRTSCACSARSATSG
jgi:allantoicase